MDKKVDKRVVEAMGVIKQVCDAYKGTKQEHVAIQQAIVCVDEALVVKEEKKVVVKKKGE